jgi:hypothetical protein
VGEQEVKESVQVCQGQEDQLQQVQGYRLLVVLEVLALPPDVVYHHQLEDQWDLCQRTVQQV